jgi:putative acetyltransferase
MSGETVMKKSLVIIFKIAETDADFKEGVNIFRQYADDLGLDLSFQDFAGELKTIDMQYNKPKGALLLVYHEDHVIGCAGLRALNSDTAELKRMFVQVAFRGNKIGEQILDRMIEIAKERNYKSIRLDTLQSMTPALNLYRSYGFYDIPAYRYNPIEGPVYMEKKLG